MTNDFLIYPSALEKIKNSGIEERVNKLKNSEDGLGYIRLEFFSHTIMDIVASLKADGYYKNIPPDFSQKYKETMNKMLNHPEDFFWRIETLSGEKKIPAKLEDVDLFSGSVPALILSNEEIWDFKRFGFDSPSEFIATVGAYILNESQMDFHPGYTWSSLRKDGSNILTEITGDSNADLRVFQHDMTNYHSFDPFGNKIEFKPSTRAGAIFAYHSTEPTLMAIALKYIDQQSIDVECKKDNAKKLIEWAESIHEEKFTFAESTRTHFHASLYFVGHPIPFPTLDKNNSTQKRSHDTLGMYGEGWYSAYISHDGDLVFSQRDSDSRENPVKDIDALFIPGDAEHIVKGLLYQSMKHLGRTSVHDLLEMINYRFSPEFKIENERLKKEYNLK